MRVLVSSDQGTAEWGGLLTAHGYQPIETPLGLSVPARDLDVGLVVITDGPDVLAQRFWLAQMTVPLLLVTRALGPALALCGRVPPLRLITHTSRATYALDDLIQMTAEIHTGVAVLGPLTQAVRIAYEQGSGDGIN